MNTTTTIAQIASDAAEEAYYQLLALPEDDDKRFLKEFAAHLRLLRRAEKQS